VSISGTLAAAATPLTAAGTRLDEDALGGLLEFYRRGHLDGLLVLGTTGEGIMLNTAERRRVAELAIAGAGELAVIVHCGAQTTQQTAALAEHAAEAAADGVAVIAPPYFAYTPDELLHHFAAAAEACSPLPFYVYEFADRSGYAVPVQVIERLRDRAVNLVGMKVSDAPYDRVAPYLQLGLDVFVGYESVVPEGLANGAVGTVSGLAAAFPEVVAALVRDPGPDNASRVEALRATLSRRAFVASVKAALRIRGLELAPDVRAPLLPLSDAEIEALRAELASLPSVEPLLA
jgi:dihydrodipicolinate synthase/N-acetylneuraminate lyase